MSSLQQLESELRKERQSVDVDHYDITIRELVRMSVEGELQRSPEYQRFFRWSVQDESRLVESLFLGLPVPPIFVATNQDNTWEMVDGLQRISTLLHFAAADAEFTEFEQGPVLEALGKDSPLRLSDLEKVPALNGLTFAELPRPLQLAFMRRFLRVTALSDKADKQVRFDLFERLNRGGVALTPQEVRACVYRGPVAKFLRSCANEKNFVSLVKLQAAHQHDGTREELVLKLFAYMNNRENFKGKVKDFLNDYMAQADGLDLTQGASLFSQVTSCLANFVQGPILRSNYNLTPQNQLEAILVATGELIDDGQTPTGPKTGWLDDEILVGASTKGTNTRSALSARIDRAKELLMGADPIVA